MRKIALVALVILTVWSCKKEPIRFSGDALKEQFETIDGKTITFESILEKHKGKTILLTFWATWCSDCRQELPRVKALQQEKTEIDYVFLSIDRSVTKWKQGVTQFGIEGDHYFMPLGWDGPFADFIDLDWITRYMIIDPEGNIKLFEVTKANNINLRESLNN